MGTTTSASKPNLHSVLGRMGLRVEEHCLAAMKFNTKEVQGTITFGERRKNHEPMADLDELRRSVDADNGV